MKNNILKFFYFFLSFIIVIIIYLSTVGIETDRFNNQLKKKIIQNNKNLNLDLKKIKLILDPLNFKIYARTVDTKIFYQKKSLELKTINIELPLSSLIKNRITSSNIKVKTKSIFLKDFIRLIRAINNKPEYIILEKSIRNGSIISDFNLNVDDKGNIKNDYEIKGSIRDTEINFLNQTEIKNINFNFNLNENNILFRDLKFQTRKINFNSEELNIKKDKSNFLISGIVKNDTSILNKNILKLLKINFKNINLNKTKFVSSNKFSFVIDKRYNFKNIFLNSEISIDKFEYKKPDLIQNYFLNIKDFILFKNHKINLLYKNKNLSIQGEGEIYLGDEFDKIKYIISKKKKDLVVNTELLLKNINLKKKDLLEIYFPDINDKINLQNQNIKIKYFKNNLSLTGSGKIKIDKNFEEISYIFKKKDKLINFNTELNLNDTNFKINDINFKKKNNTNLYLKINGNLKDDQSLKINNFLISEENNNIKFSNLIFNNSLQIVKIDEANFNYLDTEEKINNLSIKKVSDLNYIIKGTSFNGNSLIRNLLKNDDKGNKNLFEKNLKIDLDIKKVYIDETYFVKNLKGVFKIKNNKVNEANILAFFNNSQNLVFTISTNDTGEKVTTLFSSRAKPLANRYKFIKGFEDSKNGYLDFTSSKKNGFSKSKLVIDNFKVKEIPALAKLLALASLQGIADLLTGEGIRFTDFEMKFTNKNKMMKIQELYAIGPAISILLEGYVDAANFISLRGTLVPATTINRSIASIPVIGDLLIGKKVGDGVFGVSFKIKGPAENLETTVNPIKTLTPRFITRTLEKLKKN